PFNPETTIEYQLPEAIRLRIEIYDLLGRKIRSLLPSIMQVPGYYKITWDGKNDADSVVDSGIYTCRLTCENYVESIKLLMLK
ncbi:MAG: T9SS type A sorting domain-containing protein, partial [Candidatus Firestonebacteria bacterium]|nr:T9SS type A sorting domain-containing protein [Candidatus Firestonebacteria bacterium]